MRTTDGVALKQALARHGHEAAETEDGAWSVPDACVEEIDRIASAAGVRLLELAAQEGTLEQAYLDLTAAEAEFTAPRQEA